MRNLILKSNVYKLFSLNSLLQLSKIKFVYPYYHTVSDKPLDHIKHIYPIKTVKDFESDLEYLLKYFIPVDPEELHLLYEKQNGNKRYMLLSFDDGLKEVHEIILPILKRFSIPAIFFLNTAFIDNKRMFYRYKVSLLINYILNHKTTEKQIASIKNILLRNGIKNKNLNSGLLELGYSDTELINIIAELLQYDFKTYLDKEKPYLSTEQINEIIKSGYHIGSHSVDHPNYAEIDINDQVAQTSESLRLLKSLYRTKEQYFAFPFTDFGVSMDFFERIYKNSAMELNYTFGTAGIKNDVHPNHLQRIPMENLCYNAQQILKTEVLYYLLKIPFGKNVIARN